MTQREKQLAMAMLIGEMNSKLIKYHNLVNEPGNGDLKKLLLKEIMNIQADMSKPSCMSKEEFQIHADEFDFDQAIRIRLHFSSTTGLFDFRKNK